ncbi:MAG: hypothetical protein KGL44_03235 [Sphingomonadales bacterium]|nr:hypothetical protein [Sphingomonadales bacterium]
MTAQDQIHLVRKIAEPQHYVLPTARELRAQAVQRLQVGLAGLAVMLLLVGLASIINDQLRRSEAAPAAASSAPAAKSDPMVDIGVMPSASPGTPPPNAAPHP